MRDYLEFRFRAWDGEKMHYNVIPWQWDFVISRSWSKCVESTGTGILGSGGQTATFDLPVIRYENIMQYTGLKDMNGTEIYEGDLLRHPPKNGFDENNYILFEVFYHDNDCADCHIGWQMNRMHYHGSSCGGFTPAFLPKNVKSMVVVGNVLQNKELLK